MPSWTLDLPITDNNHPKFRLLLGWQKQKKKDYFRTAIKEAHLFLSKKHLINTLNNLVIKSKECSKKSNMEVIIMVNAVEVYRKKQAANKLLKLKIDENTLKEYLDNKNLLTLKFSQNHENFESNAFMVYENTLSTKVKKAYYKIRY